MKKLLLAVAFGAPIAFNVLAMEAPKAPQTSFDAWLQSPEGQTVTNAARQKLQEFKQKIEANTFYPVDMTALQAYLDEYPRGGAKGRTNWARYVALVSFFNDADTNALLINRVNALLALPNLDKEQNRSLNALLFLIRRLQDDSAMTKIALTNAATLRTLERSAEERADFVLQ